jgi:Cu/Ag efflux pump CusA
VLAALIAGAELSLGSVVGFLALLGLAARNALVLIRHLQELERDRSEKLGADLVRRGARDRLAPVLTTASAVALLALPFVVLGPRPGLEVLHPLAVVVLGGLVTSTLLSLWLLPALYLRLRAGAQPGPTAEDELLRRWVGAEPAPAPAGSAAIGPRDGGGESRA